MQLTSIETITIIIVITIGTMITRFTPFILFPEAKKTPEIINYLSNVIPTAMIGLLVIYSLKDVSILKGSHGLPEFISLSFLIMIHLKFRNVLLSIIFSTFIYMMLVQYIFI